MDTDEPAPAPAAAPDAAAAAAPPPVELSEADEALHVKLVKAKDILSGKIPIGLYLDFLFRSVEKAPHKGELDSLSSSPSPARPPYDTYPSILTGTTTRTSRS